MEDESRVTVVVPTLGRSPLLGRCLEALRGDGKDRTEIVLVRQGTRVDPPPGTVDRIVSLPENRGFAGGCNAGLAPGCRELVGTVNDDVVVEEGWLAGLIAALDRHPRAAAAQGVNVMMEDSGIADGCGIAWNRHWQAVQSGRGAPAPAPDHQVREIFGASATAVLYRRAALEEVSLSPGEFFDHRLASYYEDVDLACRLRATGWGAVLVPGARARHAGSQTGSGMPQRRLTLIYSNRLLVLARTLGAGFWFRLPRIAARDLRDLARAATRADASTAAAIVSAWMRAGLRLPGYVRSGEPRPAIAVLTRFRPD